MPQVSLFKFKPQTPPPVEIKQLEQWFENEVENASVLPYDQFELREDGPSDALPANLDLAIRIRKGMLLLKKAWAWFKRKI